MKVPTYRREGVMQLGTGARQMRIQRSGQAQAQIYEAQARTFSQIGQFALESYQQDLKMRQEIQDVEAGNYADRELIRLQEEAAAADPDQAESLFNSGVEKLKSDLVGRFDTQERLNAFNAKLDGAVLSRQLNVKKDAKKRRIDKGVAVFTEEQDRLRNRAIFGESQFERVTAIDALNENRRKAVELGFISEEEAAKQALATRKYIRVEGFYNDVNNAKSMEDFEALKNRVETMPTEDLKPSTLAKMSNLVEQEIDILLRDSDSAEAERIRQEQKISNEELTNQIEFVRRLVEENDQAAIRGLYIDLINGNYPEGITTESDKRSFMRFVDSAREHKDKQRSAFAIEQRQNAKTVTNNLVNGEVYSDEELANKRQLAVLSEDEDAIRVATFNIEFNEANKSFKTMSPTQMRQEIERLKAAKPEELFPEISDAQMDADTRRSLRSEIVKFAEKRLAVASERFAKGEVLDYLIQTGNMDVEPLTFTPEGVDKRMSELRKAAAFRDQGKDISLADDGDIDLSDINPFTSSELSQLRDIVANGDADQLAGIAIVLNPLSKMSADTYELIAQETSPMMAIAAATGNFETASLIFSGMQTEALVPDDKRAFAEQFVEKTGDIFDFPGAPKENRQHNMAAVQAVYQAIRQDPLATDEEAFDTAMELVIGPIGERDSYKLVLPRRSDGSYVEEDDMNLAFNSIDAQMLEALVPEGFKNNTYEEVAAEIQKLRFRNTRDNVYTPVYAGDSEGTSLDVLFTNDDKPFSIQWNQRFEDLLPDAKQRMLEREFSEFAVENPAAAVKIGIN